MSHHGAPGGRIMAKRRPVHSAVPSWVVTGCLKSFWIISSKHIAPAIENDMTLTACMPYRVTAYIAAGMSAAAHVYMARV